MLANLINLPRGRRTEGRCPTLTHLCWHGLRLLRPCILLPALFSAVQHDLGLPRGHTWEVDDLQTRFPFIESSTPGLPLHQTSPSPAGWPYTNIMVSSRPRRNKASHVFSSCKIKRIRLRGEGAARHIGSAVEPQAHNGKAEMTGSSTSTSRIAAGLPNARPRAHWRVFTLRQFILTAWLCPDKSYVLAPLLHCTRKAISNAGLDVLKATPPPTIDRTGGSGSDTTSDGTVEFSLVLSTTTTAGECGLKQNDDLHKKCGYNGQGVLCHRFGT